MELSCHENILPALEMSAYLSILNYVFILTSVVCFIYINKNWRNNVFQRWLQRRPLRNYAANCLQNIYILDIIASDEV